MGIDIIIANMHP